MKKLPLIIVCLCAFILSLVGAFQYFLYPSFADGTYALIGTGDGADGSNDAINFSQGKVWTIDQYGKYIWITQTRNSTISHWAWSNNQGANWSQGSESYSFLTRASVAYDSLNDKLHVVWTATDSNDGIIYRRYGITRDGSNNITDIVREDSGNVNLQLDSSSSRLLEQPVALWVNDGTTNGTLLAFWSKHGSGLNEVRGAKRTLSISAADGVAGNWQAIDESGDSFLSDPPLVAADKIYSDTSGVSAVSAKVRGGSGIHKDDLYVFVAEQDDASDDEILGYRAGWNNGSSNWSNGWTTIGTIGAMDTSLGYSLKYQLLTKPVLDSTNDRLYLGWSRWKTGGAGDTFSIAYLNATDTPSSPIDVYSALGTHSYAPTGDIAFDQSTGELYSAYIESTTNGDNGSIDYKTYNGTSLSSETRFYTSPGGTAGADGGADIPILYENRTTDDKLLFAFRRNGSLPPTGGDPHTLYWGYITLALPTNTPTPTQTPTATPIPTNTPTPTQVQSTTSSSSGGTSSHVSSCTNVKPTGAPNLFQVNVSDTKALLYFTPVTQADHYTILFGLTSGDERFNTTFSSSNSSGVLTYTLNSLSPNTTYFIRVRGDNGCMPGNVGNEIKITTKKKGNSTMSSVYQGVTLVNGNSCEYIVKSGDTLSKIAQQRLGNKNRYQEIIATNKTTYPSLNKSSAIRIGWKLRVGC